MNNSLRIGLFGFGRFGRNIFRLGHKDPRYNFVAISDLGNVEAMHYLLVRDSVHGSMNDEIALVGNYLKYDNHSVRLLPGGTPGIIPWDAYDVDVVIDTTGAYRHRDELQLHLDAGANRDLVSKLPIDGLRHPWAVLKPKPDWTLYPNAAALHPEEGKRQWYQ